MRTGGLGGAKGVEGVEGGSNEGGQRRGPANFLPPSRGAVARPGFRLHGATVPRDYQCPFYKIL